MKTKILQVLREKGDFVSGQDLCSQLGVSRTAVWKAISQLREEGYEIEAIQNKGYRMGNVPDTLLPHELESIRKTCWAGKKIFYYDHLESTNATAKKLAEEGAGHGSLVIADMQTAGKGRRGRHWNSPKGEGIWATLILKPDIEPGRAAMLTLVMAMAVTRAIERVTGLTPQIKWPNDVVLEGKKVCGILTEMSMQTDFVNHIVIGTGINVHNQEFTGELADKATSLDVQLKRAVGHEKKKVKRAELLEAILEEFEINYKKYTETMDISLIMESYNSYLVNRNKMVMVLDPKGAYEGLALGINETGELLVERNGRTERIVSGEVSVRGVYGYV